MGLTVRQLLSYFGLSSCGTTSSVVQPQDQNSGGEADTIPFESLTSQTDSAKIKFSRTNRTQMLIRQTAFTYGLAGGLLGGTLSISGLYLAITRSQPHVKSILPQGFEVNALSSENLQRREGTRDFLENDPITSILDAFSEVSGKVADYVKPAVVLISFPGEKQAIGSGFIYRSDGIIITNYHVVENSPLGMVKVTFLDNQDSIGQVIGVDPKTDTAIIKVDRDNLPSLEIETNETKPGAWVMAVGLQPPCLGWSVTTGTLSAEDRNSITVNGLLQTTVPINPGSSGSPLVNRKGKVVGLNEAASPGNNLSFSVPAKTLQKVVPVLITKGMANYYDVPDPSLIPIR